MRLRSEARAPSRAPRRRRVPSREAWWLLASRCRRSRSALRSRLGQTHAGAGAFRRPDLRPLPASLPPGLIGACHDRSSWAVFLGRLALVFDIRRPRPLQSRSTVLRFGTEDREPLGVVGGWTQCPSARSLGGSLGRLTRAGQVAERAPAWKPSIVSPFVVMTFLDDGWGAPISRGVNESPPSMGPYPLASGAPR